MFCLSKGLGAPVGSMLTGSAPFIAEARRVRKALGGGLRQVGVLAAAGIIALEEGPRLLERDHARARRLHEGVSRVRGALVERPETNMVFVRAEAGPKSYPKIQEKLEAEGVLAFALGEIGVRFVTHRDVDDADVERAIAALAKIVPGL
jgi:threonine aldolase